MMLKELVIGGAQLGYKYGINNKYDYNLNNTIKNIKYLKSKKIKCFDTSNLYKSSNKIIGSLNKDKGNKYYAKFYINEKRLLNSKNKRKYLNYFFNKVYKDLNTEKIYCLSFHRYNQINKFNKIILKYLLKLKKNNKIAKIGVSITTSKELIKSIELKDIDLIQLPFHILEHRWENYIDKFHQAKKIGKIFQVRSIFLQGLFLTDKQDLWLKANCNFSDKIFNWLEKYKLKTKSKNLRQLLIRYIISTDWIDSIVIGFNIKKEIVENISYLNNKKLSKRIIDDINKNKIKLNENILNPSNWKL